MNAQQAGLARRADAQRNRTRILVVTREAIEETGAEPSMAEIARRAGVGMATLYRNFPGRLDLLAELYREQVDELCAAAATPERDDPTAAFFAWLERFDQAGGRKAPLASLLLADGAVGVPVVTSSRARVVDAGQPLFAAAQRAGGIRTDLSLRQVLDAVVAVAQVADDPAFPRRAVALVFDGLRHTAEGHPGMA